MQKSWEPRFTERLSPDVSAADIDRFRDDIVEDVRKEIANRHLHASQIRLHESEIIDIIESADGFAQVLPEDKFFIIDKLQKADHIVAMTGDGVNDAPALKKADAGIAVSGATDAARAAADIVLLLPGLSVIINAISEARTVFERMKSYAIFRIAETTRVIVFMSLSILIFNFYPVTAVMIIILALLNDIPIMMIAYDNARPQAKPVRWDMREVMTISSVLGIAGVLASFLLYYGLEQFGYSQALIQNAHFPQARCRRTLDDLHHAHGRKAFLEKAVSLAQVFPSRVWFPQHRNARGRLWNFYDTHRLARCGTHLGVCDALVPVQRFRKGAGL